MTKIVNNDKLTFIFTQYGLNRIAEALSDPLVDIYITKIKVGSGSNEEYYEPQIDQKDLKGAIPGGEFYVTEKELLEDGITVSFRSVIPESFGNCDIREIGLYETYNGEDNLFAISTQQPMVKPTVDDNYLISIDYYIFLKAQNLANIYDQIILDPINQLVTDRDLEELMSSILFTHGNLIDQVGHNTQVIGLNRASQLQKIIEEEKENFGYLTSYKDFSDLINAVSPSSIFAYWLFNYPRRISSRASIVDIGQKANYLSTNKQVNQYKRNYFGVMPMLEFKNNDYFYLSPDIELNLLNDSRTADSNFSMIFALSPITKGVKRTLLARSNYSTKSHVFEINETADRKLEVLLFSDKDNYLRFTSPVNSIPEEAHIIILSYDANTNSINASVNGNVIKLAREVIGTYTCMNNNPTQIYGFKAHAEETKFTDSSSNPTEIYNADGSPVLEDWTIENNKVYYKNNEATYDSTKNTNTDVLYAWTFEDFSHVSHTIYTKVYPITSVEDTLYNADYTKYTGDEFTIVEGETGTFYVKYSGDYTAERDSSSDIQAKVIYAFTWSSQEENIWSNSNASPTVLYNNDGSLYTGDLWSISNNSIIYQGKYLATYSSSLNKTLNILGITSFVIAENGNKEQFIDSNVGLVSVIKEKLSNDTLAALALTLEATLGNNPCMRK